LSLNISKEEAVPHLSYFVVLVLKNPELKYNLLGTLKGMVEIL
jgi:hypothetical protein